MQAAVVIVTTILSPGRLARELAAAAAVAAPQVGQLSQFTGLVSTVVAVIQGLALVGCALGFIWAGLKFNSADPGAKQQAGGAAIGTALVAGAVLVVQFIKGSFGL